MSTTTGLDLLAHANVLTRQLRRTTEPVSAEQWNMFDATVHRLLLEIAGLNALHVRPGDPSRSAMHLAMQNYPRPLRAPIGASMSPEQAASFLGREGSTVRRYVKNGHLRAEVRDGRLHLDAADIPDQVDVPPADPADPHPLAKASCALGALADLLHQARDDAAPVLDHRGEIAGASIHLLSLAAAAARHTLAHGPLDEVVRPVLVARYAERAIDTLRDVAHRPASLHDILAVSGDATCGPPVERLEAALQQWVQATRRELDQMIPSVDVIRQMANQGAHMCAVVRALATQEAPGTAELGLPAPQVLHEAADSLNTGERAWRHVTTLSRPRHEFVTASRDLYEALHAVGTALQQGDPHGDRAYAAPALRHALHGVTELVIATRGLPETFLNAGVLFAPATAIAAKEELVTQRLRHEHVPVNYTDVPNLVHDWVDACAAAHRVRFQVSITPESRLCATAGAGRNRAIERRI
ncbi:hypothetical protein N864_16390 [Intrasporangium chromatireducens Q5-1]|uniref:Uncharacterized protein n=1 Tax=Intrasporangium chromatireducens Q5-1 TaxID=584657 RepID=W9GKP1_9MICO|nr:hypothetical protein [Intrasporangium chromatireducens]EWT06831.1 hypothetical protein N864_16390 [Intrasporangium chromatireducens Q5-1]